MYIEKDVLMLMFLGVMFMIACLGGVALGLVLTRLNQRLVATTTIPVPNGLPAPIRASTRRNGHWKSHVFKRVLYESIGEFVAQLNARGIRLQSVTQANGDRYCTVYAEEWIPAALVRE